MSALDAQTARARHLAPALAEHLISRRHSVSAAERQSYAALVRMANGVERLWAATPGARRSRSRALFEAVAQDILTARWMPGKLSRDQLMASMAEILAQLLQDTSAAQTGELDLFVRALEQLALPVLA